MGHGARPRQVPAAGIGAQVFTAVFGFSAGVQDLQWSLQRFPEFVAACQPDFRLMARRPGVVRRRGLRGLPGRREPRLPQRCRPAAVEHTHGHAVPLQDEPCPCGFGHAAVVIHQYLLRAVNAQRANGRLPCLCMMK